MKRIKTFNLLALSACLLALSCGKEAPFVPEVHDQQPEVRDPWTLYPENYIRVPGPVHTITAGCETKSQLVQDGQDNYDVAWSAHDQFIVLGIQEEGAEVPVYAASYITEEGGTNAEFTSGESLGNYTELHAFYPESQFMYAGKATISGVERWILSVNYPNVQTATPGSVAEEANLSYAHPASLDNALSFTNLVSIVKFRLEGAKASEVTSVTFRGLNAVAGGLAIYYRDGLPRLLTNMEVEGHPRTRNVTLQGTFAAGNEYYIALAPSQQDAFSMVFANAEGQSTTLTATSGMTFNRSEINDFGTITIDDFTDVHSMDPIKYMSASAPGAQKVVSIVVLPDGYTASELDDYEMQAKAAMNALFNTEPFKTYKDYFNVWIMKVASNESGANITDGQGNITQRVDCYFKSKWGASSYGDMSADFDRIYSFLNMNCPDVINGTHTELNIPVLIIINDTRYGGITHTWSDGKSCCMVPTTDRELTWRYPSRKARTDEIIENPSLEADLIDTPEEELEEVGTHSGTWLNTVVHEFGGHSFGRLGDEYWCDDSFASDCTVPYQDWNGDDQVPFNLNLSDDPANPLWKNVLLDDSGNARSELIAKNEPCALRIGVFQGGDVSPFNRWRCEKVSCMVDNRFYFSIYQRYLIVQRIYNLADVYYDDEYKRINDFFNNDVMEDPVRDMVPSGVYGVSNALPPRPVPMLPPPVFHED